MKTSRAEWKVFAGVIVLLMFLFLAFPAMAQERRVVRVGFPIQAGFTMKDGGGQYTGYTYDYLQELAQYTQWEYEFVEVEGNLDESFPVLLEMLEKGEIDLLGGMSYSEALTERYGYPARAYGETSLILSVDADNQEITPANFTELEILRVAVLGQGGRQQEALKQFLNSNIQKYELVHCETSQALKDTLKENKADVILETEVGLESGFRIIAKFSSTPFYMAVTKENTELLRELNAGVTQLHETEPNLISGLHHKYFSKVTGPIVYEKEEKDYLEQAGTLEVAVLDGKVPIQKIDPKNGSAMGIAVDFLDYISGETGLEFEYIGVSDIEEYEALIRNKEIDLILAVPGTSRVSGQYGMMHTLPYMSVTQILLVHKGIDPGNLHGKTEAVYEAFYTADDKAGMVKQYDSPEEVMKAVDEGEADYCRINNYSFQACINSRVYKNITAIVMTESERQNISFGVVKGTDLVLHSILNKVIAYMPDAKREKILYESSISREQPPLMEYIKENPAPFVALILLFITVLVVFALINYQSRFAMDRKMALEYQRYRQLSEVVGESVYEYDFKDDILRFSGNGVRKLGVSEVIPDFKAFGLNKMKEKGISGEESLYHWIMEKKDGTKDIQIDISRDPERWYRVTSKVVRDQQGSPVYAIGRVWDVQKEKIEKERLLKKARNDGITGIYNSSTIREMITDEVEALRTEGALMIIDIDYFKEINDRFGHSVGDSVLTQIGKNIREVFDGDIFGRLGGDEFIIFIPGTFEKKGILKKVNLIRRGLGKIEVAPEWRGITASIGIAVKSQEDNFETLYQKADGLLYEVKRDGRNGYRIG